MPFKFRRISYRIFREFPTEIQNKNPLINFLWIFSRNSGELHHEILRNFFSYFQKLPEESFSGDLLQEVSDKFLWGFRRVHTENFENIPRKFWSFAGNSRSFSLKFSQENLRFFLKIFSRIFPVFFFRNFARKFSKISSGNIPDFLRKKSLGNSYKFPRKIQIK